MFQETVQERNEHGHSMVPTFLIERHRNSDNLHLRLTGVFDEEAALSLLEELHKHRASVGKIFIHTAALREVLAQGAGMFRNQLASLDRPAAEIIFTGERGEELALKGPGIRFIK